MSGYKIGEKDWYKKIENFANNHWIKKFSFWANNYFLPASWFVAGYTTGIALVVLFFPTITIHMLGVETLLSTLMASLLVVLVFPFAGYLLLSLILVSLEPLKDERKIPDQLNIQQLLFRQIERCSEVSVSNNEKKIEGCVGVLFQMVPNSVHLAVISRANDYKTIDGNIETIDYRSLFNVIMQELEKMKNTWKQDSELMM